MSKNLTLVECDAARAEVLFGDIGKVRAWLTGFQAAGKSGPPGEDALRQMQIILRESISKASGGKTVA